MSIGTADKKWALAVFLSLLLVYNANRAFFPTPDVVSTVYSAVSEVEHGALSFDPATQPYMFGWLYRDRYGRSSGGTFAAWDDNIAARPASEQLLSGHLHMLPLPYYTYRAIGSGRYLSTFGFVPTLIVLPIFEVAHCFVPDLHGDPWFVWYASKIVASVLVAWSAALLYLCCLFFTGRNPALAIAFAYGLGTCVWVLLSQTMWQQTGNLWLLSIGVYLWLAGTRGTAGNLGLVGAGMAFGLATACRGTSFFFLLAAITYLALRRRHGLLGYVIGALVALGAIGLLNFTYTGHLWVNGETMASPAIALRETGSAALFQTPLSVGLAGLLVSPSRGLFVFSPFFLFARARKINELTPLLAASLAVLATQARWYDWWGGWTYGYRPIVDMTLVWCLMLAPIVDGFSGRRRALFAVAVAWSILVQVVGVNGYPGSPWWDGTDAAGHSADISFPEHRGRLWQWRDSEIVFYTANFARAGQNKRALMEAWLTGLTRPLMDLHLTAPLPGDANAPPARPAPGRKPSGPPSLIRPA